MHGIGRSGWRWDYWWKKSLLFSWPHSMHPMIHTHATPYLYVIYIYYSYNMVLCKVKVFVVHHYLKTHILYRCTGAGRGGWKKIWFFPHPTVCIPWETQSWYYRFLSCLYTYYSYRSELWEEKIKNDRNHYPPLCHWKVTSKFCDVNNDKTKQKGKSLTRLTVGGSQQKKTSIRLIRAIFPGVFIVSNICHPVKNRITKCFLGGMWSSWNHVFS